MLHFFRYIGIYQIHIPNLVIKDLDLIKQITIKDFDHFQDHRVIVDEKMDPLFGKNLISLKGIFTNWKIYIILKMYNIIY